jgi:hypothetical protein
MPEHLPKDAPTCLIFAFDRTLDHTQVVAMAELVDHAIARNGELRLLLDLRKTEHFALGAFLSPKGLLTSIKSIGPVSRYAVVGAPALAAAAVESFGTILPLEARAFAAADYAAAHDWVTGAGALPSAKDL